MTTTRKKVENLAPLAILSVLYLGIIMFINPLREMCLDDDWIYALTVKHLIQTGEYRLHDWASANLPFQVYWASFFSAIGGFSLATLRLSTVVLGFFGLLALYGLAREHDFAPLQAVILALCMVVNPLFIHLDFSYMTDIPFLSCLIVALFGYTRAIRQQSYTLMIMSSLAATCAILTRQFGVALIGGLALSWIMSTKRRKEASFYAVGAMLPILGAILQFLDATMHPNWMMLHYVLPLQRAYLVDPGIFAKTFWRLAVMAPYMAFFALPIVLVAMLVTGRRVAFVRSVGGGGLRIRSDRVIPALLAVLIAAGLLWGYSAGYSGLGMPYLPWNLGVLAGMGVVVHAIVTCICVAGGIWIYSVFVRRYVDRRAWGRISESQRFVDHTAVFSLLFALAFLKIGDEYLLVFVPYVLLVAGRHVKDGIAVFRVPVVIASVLILAGSCFWTRSLMTEAEAFWRGGEMIRTSGVEPNRVFVNWIWNSYYGASEAYQDEVGGRTYNKEFTFSDDFFGRWLAEQRSKADFLVIGSLGEKPAHQRWKVVAEVDYTLPILGARELFIVHRQRAPVRP